MKKLLVLLTFWASFAHAGLETGTYIKDLVSTNPTPNDPKSEGDDHLRLIKSTIQNSFPGAAGAVVIAGTDGGIADAYTLTPTPALPSYTTKSIVVFIPVANNLTTTPTLNISGLGAVTIVGVDGNALSAGDLVSGKTYEAVYNGTNFVLRSTVPIDSPPLKGTPTAPTAAAGTNNTQLATTAFVQNTAFSSALPNQSGNAGKVTTTDGTTASWLGGANGNLLIGNGAGFTVAPITAGTGILVTNGAGSITVSNTQSQALVLIGTQTANGTSPYLTFTNLSGYSNYRLVLSNLTAASAIDYGLQFGYGSSPTWVTSGYNYALDAFSGASTIWAYCGSTASNSVQFTCNAGSFSGNYDIQLASTSFTVNGMGTENPQATPT